MVFYPQKMWIKLVAAGLSIRKMKEKTQLFKYDQILL